MRHATENSRFDSSQTRPKLTPTGYPEPCVKQRPRVLERSRRHAECVRHSVARTLVFTASILYRRSPYKHDCHKFAPDSVDFN